MRSERHRVVIVTTGAVTLGVGVLLAAGVALERPIREHWYISRLRTDDLEESLEAADRLADVGSVKAIPHLTRALTRTMLLSEGKRGTSLFSLLKELYLELSSREQIIASLRQRLRGNLSFGSQQKMNKQLVLLQNQIASLNTNVEAMVSRLLNTESYHALVQIVKREGEAALPFLIRELENESWQARWVTVHVLGELGRQVGEAAAVVEKVCEDSNQHVRHAAAGALRKIRGRAKRNDA